MFVEQSDGISDITIINVLKGIYYSWIFYDISKSEAIHLLKNYVLVHCGYLYKNTCNRNQL